MVTPLILYEGQDKPIENKGVCKYSITCVQRPCKESNKSGLLEQVVFNCRLYLVDLIRGVVTGQWSLKAVDCLYRWSLIQVVFNHITLLSIKYLVKDSLVVTTYNK